MTSIFLYLKKFKTNKMRKILLVAVSAFGLISCTNELNELKVKESSLLKKYDSISNKYSSLLKETDDLLVKVGNEKIDILQTEYEGGKTAAAKDYVKSLENIIELNNEIISKDKKQLDKIVVSLDSVRKRIKVLK